MLTKITVRLFKRFRNAEIELGNPVVLIGPNDSGKTTALQGLALWGYGMKRWVEKRSGKPKAQQRTGVAINRRDLVALPIPDAKLLWHQLHVRNTDRSGDKPRTSNLRIDVTVEGVTDAHQWVCGLEFDYANPESIYVRPLRVDDDGSQERMPIPDGATETSIAYLPPMSGLASNERRLDPGAIDVLIGEGRTAEVLRNLLWLVYERRDKPEAWSHVTETMNKLFGVDIHPPEYVSGRGEITSSYTDGHGVELDLASSGRGFQQTLLVLTYLSLRPGSVLLLDEPDAHLEILRQRQMYQVLSETVSAQGSQVVIASHSEVIMDEAADRDVLVAFVGEPHRIDDRGHQHAKALKEIGFDQYFQAEQKGWVLYIEGSTDLSILRSFAKLLDHSAASLLERPFVHYVGNNPQDARRHFHGLAEAKEDLRGFALFDRLEGADRLHDHEALREYALSRREIENYLAFPEVLLAWAESTAEGIAVGPLFERPERERRLQSMERAIERFVPLVAREDREDSWWHDTKATDGFLDRLFDWYFRDLGIPNLMRKSDYHRLATFVPDELLDEEIVEVLDLLSEHVGDIDSEPESQL